MLGVGVHLNGLTHPGELTGLGDDGVVMVELKLQNRHGGADDAVLHVCLPYLSGGYPPYRKVCKVFHPRVLAWDFLSGFG